MANTVTVNRRVERVTADERSREEETAPDERSREEETAPDERSRREQAAAVPAPQPAPMPELPGITAIRWANSAAALTGAVFVDRSHRGVITLTGPERLSWLHNISSQHVADLADGATVENLSLDGQGRVEDHWIQTELGGVSYLDTEPWRTEPLLAYLKRMVFWADVVPDAVDYGVLSLLGPALSEPKVPRCAGH